MLDWWKNRFRRRSPEPSEGSSGAPLFFHEDEYRQAELLPVGARAFCEAELARMDALAIEHAAESDGSSDLYVRKDPPSMLPDLSIRLSALTSALEPTLTGTDHVTTGYSTQQVPSRRTRGWYKDTFCLFAEQNRGIVQSIWLGGSPGSLSPGWIASALQGVPKSDEMLLVDWSWSAVVPLRDTGTLSAYFANRAEDT